MARRTTGRPPASHPAQARVEDEARFHPILIVLHWLSFAILLPLVLPGLLVDADGATLMPPLSRDTHAQLGMLLLLITVLRLGLRLVLGVPRPVTHEPSVVRGLGRVVHVALYVALLLTALSGLVIWLQGCVWACAVHPLSRMVLVSLVALHAAAPMLHHFHLDTPVLWGILGVWKRRR